MRFRFSTYSAVIDFTNQDYGCIEIDAFISKLTQTITINDLDDWTVVFKAIFCKDNYVANCKRVITCRTEPKEKIYCTRIPIPSNKDIHWGAAKKQYTYEQPFVEKNWFNLDIDFKEFDSAKDYVIASMTKGISVFLQKGIIVQGHKIKF